MDKRLLEIVTDHPYIIRSVDQSALKKHTTWKPFRQLLDISWGSVKHLHILKNDRYTHFDRMDMPQGIYESRDHSWVLLLGNFVAVDQQIIDLCAPNLELLDIRADYPELLDISSCCNLRHLYARSPIFSTVQGFMLNGIGNLTKLETLSLYRVMFEEDLDLSGITSLGQLVIQGFPQLHQNVNGIHKLKGLSHLDLWRVTWNGDINLSNSPNLRLLSLWDGFDSSVDKGRFYGLHNIHKLDTLQLRGNQAACISELPLMPSLHSLYLTNCPEITDSLGIHQLTNLEVLSISKTSTRKLPEGIRKLKNLNRLDLSNLDLEEFPHWLPELGLRFHKGNGGAGICLRDTTVKGVDMSIFDQPHDVILKWFEELRHNSMVPLQEVKVVFLGDGEAGKTHTIARLLNDGNTPKSEDFDDKATPGIVIKDKHYEMDDKTVNVHFWDFGGQEILHSMHRMFLTERTLYVVLLNARDDTQDDRARYWLHNIRSFAGNSPVLLVLNKIDQNPNASVNERKLRELYSGLRRVVSLSALEYSPEQFNAALTYALKEEIMALDTVGTLWPTSWAKLKTGLETMKSNFITGSEYKRMCQDSGVDKNEKELLRWFNDLGVSFCYQGSRRLEHYVILRPEWITNGIYILLFNKSDETKNGIIPKKVVYEMLDPEDENTYRRVLGGVTYDVNETEYVLEVMRKFRLSYAVSNEEEFIPALCQRDSMPIAKGYADDPDALEFRLTYDHLPDNVIHRLMVEMRQDLQLSDVWRTGALLRQQGTGLSAVVEGEDNVLHIFVRSDDPAHRPNTYLCILKENIDRINQDMKLAPPFAEVVYKTDSGRECFDYQDLLNAQHDGEETYRSKLLRRRLSIQDILNQTGRGAELELIKLRNAILTACIQMQNNRSFWSANDENRIEDERNTYLRDTLINLGYLVNDQHLQGLGSGSRGYGELDLDIRQNKDIPWTVLEALRIRDGNKNEWNRHLKKLLDNYNPGGMRHLFLLTYVDCSKDEIGDILRTFSEHIKWHDEGPYVRLENTFTHVPLPQFGDPTYLMVMRCTYDRSGAPTTVTHIFVRMGA